MEDNNIFNSANEEQKNNFNTYISNIIMADEIINNPKSSDQQKQTSKNIKKNSTVGLISTISEVLDKNGEIKESFGVLLDPTFDITKDWNPESQPNLSSDGKNQLENLKKSKIWKSLTDKINELRSNIDNVTLKNLQEQFNDIKTNGDTSGEKSQKLSISIESAADKYGEKLSTSQKDEIEKRTGTSWKEFIIFFLKFLLIAGSVVTSIFLFIRPLLCNMANQDSGCKVTDPNGKSSLLVWNQGLSCNATQDCTYDSICGGCGNSSQQPPNSPPCCCSSAVDANAKNHTGWEYQYVCSNIWDQLTKLGQSLLTDLSPQNLVNNLKKIAETIGIGIAILFGIVILFYILKFGIKYAEERLEPENSEE